MYPFLPGHVTRPKECKKLYLIQLPKKSACLLPFNRSVSPFEVDLLIYVNRGVERAKKHETSRRPTV